MGCAWTFRQGQPFASSRATSRAWQLVALSGLRECMAQRFGDGLLDDPAVKAQALTRMKQAGFGHSGKP